MRLISYLKAYIFTALRNAMRCAILVIVILSVRPSVRLSVTLVDCVHMVRPTIMISSQYGSRMILVSGDIRFIPKFKGGRSPRGRALNDGWVGTNWRFSTFKPQCLRNDARYDKGYNRKSGTRFRLVPKSTTLVDREMTLGGNYALCCITLMFFGANH